VHRRLRPRRGFIFLLGSRAIVSDEPGSEAIVARCPRCNQESELVPKRYRNWFTLFFIPLFPVSGSKRITQCSKCGARFPIPVEELRNRVAQADGQQNQQAIALYNSLRASPVNSITLNQLLGLYASMKEYDQAISAAADFPQALHASEQCMTTLGRVYLAQHNSAEALKWFDAAIERNPELGEAQYFKGVAHLMSVPPDAARAVPAARAARKAGYPNADALVRQAEEKARET
jgi:tetratricopeptide (TPR) repeat protein